MKRVLFYDAYARDKVMGGSSISLQRLLSHRKDKNLHYYFLVNQLNEKYYEDNIKGLGITSFKINFPKALFLYNKKYEKGRIKQVLLFLLIIIPLCLKIAFLLRKNKIDKVVCNEVRASLTIGPGVRMAALPLITFVRSDYLIDDITTKAALLISSGILCVSEGLGRLIDKRFHRKMKIICDGIEFKPVDVEGPKDGITIINVANIVPIKGQMVLLQALNDLKEKYGNVKCFIVGGIVDGNYFNFLKAYTEKNKLEEHVIFTGFVKDTGEYLSKASIYVQPSFHEGLPLAIIEALLYGLPVISSSLPGISSIVINNNTGLIFEKGDYKDLVNKVITLIEDSKLRAYLGTNGRKLVKEQYNIDNMVKKFEDYIAK